jgi:hypothetical protein
LPNEIIILKNLAKQEKTHPNSLVSCLPFFTGKNCPRARIYARCSPTRIQRTSGIGRQIELLCYCICSYIAAAAAASQAQQQPAAAASKRAAAASQS